MQPGMIKDMDSRIRPENVAQLLMCLPRIHEPQGSIPSNREKKMGTNLITQEAMLDTCTKALRLFFSLGLYWKDG